VIHQIAAQDQQKKAAALWVKPQPYAIFRQDSRLFIFAPL